MHVIGTAGHVDHGKSTLVRALTGIDPDRLAEEKRRGLTIDLGFAWLDLPSGRQVGIVDVPGHEKFIKNMLAGVGAINVNLFIVAANEGWKPQSQEHLDILNLLGVESAIVVVTKIDMVQQDELKLVTEQIDAKLAGTSLENAPIMAVSATRGIGLEEMILELDRVLEATPAAPDDGRPRLWIDRVFSIKGSGTVVTGTLTGGSLEKAQEVEILPDGERARIRAIQSHRKELPRLLPGNRTALNLSGLEHQQLQRGDILTRPGIWVTTRSVVASIQFLSRLQHEPAERGAFKLYSGSVELDAEIRFLEAAPQPGESATALIRLDRSTVLDFGDRFILRDSGRRETLGGGRVLEAHPDLGRAGRKGLAKGAKTRLEVKDRTQYVQVLLDEVGYLALSDISRRTGLRWEEARSVASIRLPSYLVSPTAFDEMSGAVLTEVRKHQGAHDLDAGMSLPALRAASRIEPQVINELISELVKQGHLVEEATTIRTPDFKARTESPEASKLLAKLDSSGASPPGVAEINVEFGPNLVKALVREGKLIQVSPNLVFSSIWLNDLKMQVEKKLREEGPFSVAGFRDLVQTTRKYAVPLLEYLDQIGFTRREGDLRTLGPKAQSHSEVEQGFP